MSVALVAKCVIDYCQRYAIHIVKDVLTSYKTNCFGFESGYAVRVEACTRRLVYSVIVRI